MVVRSATARRQRLHDQARREILRSAGEVFARRGYAAATLADLAQAAGYAPPSLYRYFESKEEIFRSLVELLLEELDATFAAPADPARPLAARLEALLLAQARLAEAQRANFDLVSGPGPDAPCTIAGRRVGDPGAGLAYYEERMRDWLRRNAARRELRHPPELAARALAGLTFAFHHRPLEGADPAARARLIVDLALRGSARAVAPAAPPSRRRGATP
jgi:AcrR family transcriptional regulator